MNDAKPARNASGIRPAMTRQGSKRASSSSMRRSTSGSSGGDSGRRRRLARGSSATRPRRARPRRRARPPRGNSQASRSKPCVAGRAMTDRPNVAISLSSISERVSPGGDPPRDEGLHAQRDRRARLVERRVTGRADDLSLELALSRVSFARERGRGGEQQRRESYEESASWMHCSSVSLVTAPGTCATTRPLRSAQNVSGTPVSPYLV